MLSQRTAVALWAGLVIMGLAWWAPGYLQVAGNLRRIDSLYSARLQFDEEYQRRWQIGSSSIDSAKDRLLARIQLRQRATSESLAALGLDKEPPTVDDLQSARTAMLPDLVQLRRQGWAILGTALGLGVILLGLTKRKEQNPHVAERAG